MARQARHGAAWRGLVGHSSILVDPACYELAHAFIEDDKRVDATEANIMGLAQDIQTAIEDWFGAREANQ